MAVTLSVIVPVYGTKAYLPACLESLRIQSLRDVEFILVDDASPDGAQAVMEDFVRRDNRFRVVRHEKNRGLFAARLTGAKQAKGEFIAFLDSDDTVSVDFYRAAVRLAQERQLDLVMGDTIWQRENGERFVRPVHADQMLEEELHGEAVRRAFFGQAMSCYSWHTIWNKVIRRTLWQQCAPHYEKLTAHIVMTEDIAFSTVLFYFARHVGRHRGDGVFYCEHAASSTGDAQREKRFRKNYTDIVQVFEFAEDFLRAQQAPWEMQRLNAARRWYARMWQPLCRQYAHTPAQQQEIAALTQRLCPSFVTPETEDTRDLFWFDQPMMPWHDGTEKIKRAILGLDGVDCPVISFDVFDTLILRPFREPQDLFSMLEKPWQRAGRRNMTSFASARVEAEKAARRWLPEGRCEVTLWNIYSAMQYLLGLTDGCVAQMTFHEREAEVRFCRARKTGVQLLSLAKEAGRRVVLTSDMYLDRATIERMLQKCGVPESSYEAFFLSNEQNALKWDGGLYRVLLEKLHVSPEKVLHIGDQPGNDVAAAQKEGLRAMLLPRPAEVLLDASRTQLTRLGRGCMAGFADPAALEPLAFRCAQALAANRFFDDGWAFSAADSAFGASPARLGYYAVGMHVLALAQWLLEKCRREGVKRLVFLARDGALVRQAVELLRRPEDTLETDYIPASRRCLLPALMANPADLAALPVNWRSYTPEKMLSLLSFCTLDMPEEAQHRQVEEAGFGWNAAFPEKRRFDEFMRFFRETLYDGCRHQAAYSLAREYYEEKLPPGTLCFDMGYSGRLQAALCQLVQRPVPVCFVHCSGESAQRLGAAYGFPVDSFYPVQPAMSGAFREFLLSSDEAPCIGFERREGRVVPFCVAQEEHPATQFLVRCIHHHALAFVRDFRDTFPAETWLDVSSCLMPLSMPFEGVLRDLPEADLTLFQQIPFEDAVFAGQDALDLATLVRDQSREAAQKAKQLGATGAPTRMVGFIPEQTPLVKRTIGFLLFDRHLFREKLKKRLAKLPGRKKNAG